MGDVREEEPPAERTVRRTEAAAICVALGVLGIAFGAYLVLSWLLPDGADWVARSVSAVMGFWLATRAYRRVLRSRGFESCGLGVRLREDR
jgi:hypothetical protein